MAFKLLENKHNTTMSDIITINGYSVRVYPDECPSNPFEDWDCNPPLLTYSHSLKSYGEFPDIQEIISTAPKSTWDRGNRLKVIKGLNCSLKDFADNRKYYGSSVEEEVGDQLSKQSPKPGSWSSATDYFEALEYALKLAGIPYHSMQSNGYSQGDSALVIAVATKEWIEKVGCSEEHWESACESACKLYGYWAWGDCYGISEILDPDGDEVPDSSCWGFYGPHEESGLLDAAKDSIRCDEEAKAKESIESFIAACGDIATTA